MYMRSLFVKGVTP